jgi:hypothetical protein
MEEHMAFAGGYEYEDALELEILDMEGEFDKPLLELDSPQLVEDRKSADLYQIRISGFDWQKSTAPSVQNDPPDRPVLKLHNEAVAKTTREIVSRIIPEGKCVTVLVGGFADPGQERAIGDTISEQRANAIANQIRAKLPAELVREYVRRYGVRPAANYLDAVTFRVVGMGINSPKRPSATHPGRALNRRVEVSIGKRSC